MKCFLPDRAFLLEKKAKKNLFVIIKLIICLFLNITNKNIVFYTEKRKKIKSVQTDRIASVASRQVLTI